MQKLTYAKLQLKRAFRYYPAVLAVTLLLVLGVSMVAVILLKDRGNKDIRQPINIGLVGNTSGTYLNIGIETIREVDSIGMSVNFVDATEAEAKKMLRNGKLEAYVLVPDGFIAAIEQGENKPLTFVTLDGPASFGTVISQEIIEMLSGMVTESQSAVYGMQELVADCGGKNPYDEGDYLSLRYISYILQRNECYEKLAVGMHSGISTGGYYVAGALVFFLLLWGISCGAYMTRKQTSLSRVLASRGFGALPQTFGNYAAYAIPGFVSLLLICTVAGIAVGGRSLPIEELKNYSFIRFFLLAWKLLPVFCMITALQYLLYEAVSGTVPTLLTQFLAAIGLGYISGCFYPDQFFPPVVQKFAAVLPSGVACRYSREMLSDKFEVTLLVPILLYTVVFLGLSVVILKHRIAEE
ncbi:MAG: ABC transporter permease, partial [Clostridia bacterium]|nr:ABC transporter permease [Clostridia bacterium]